MLMNWPTNNCLEDILLPSAVLWWCCCSSSILEKRVPPVEKCITWITIFIAVLLSVNLVIKIELLPCQSWPDLSDQIINKPAIRFCALIGLTDFQHIYFSLKNYSHLSKMCCKIFNPCWITQLGLEPFLFCIMLIVLIVGWQLAKYFVIFLPPLPR